MNERSQALQALDELKALSKQKYVSPNSFAVVYIGLSEKDQALVWLEKAYEDRSLSLAYLKANPVWDPLRSDPPFQDLLRRIGLPP